MKSDGFVFFRSVWESYQELKRKDAALAEKFLTAVIEYGLEGEYDESDPFINALMGSVTVGIDNAHSRRTISQDNGSKGGRPKLYSPDRIAELVAQGKTSQQIADELGCSLKTVQRALKELRTTQVVSQPFSF